MAQQSTESEKKEPTNPYELYLVLQANISIIQGNNPLEPLNENPDFFVGDVFQGKVSTEYDKYIQLRAASKTNKKQWIAITESKGINKSIMNVFSPNITDYFHLQIGATATAKCKFLNKFLTKTVDEIYGIFLGQDSIATVIITYLPFSYPVFTANGTLFRGFGHFTQFSVPYFHSKSHCLEYLRRIEELRKDTIELLNNEQIDEDQKKEKKKLEDIQFERKLMLKFNENMDFEAKHDPEAIKQRENMTEDEKEEELEELEAEKLLDAEYLNKIVSVKKGSLPSWIEAIYKNIPSSNGYYYCVELYFIDNQNMVPFKKDEYLEQNKYLDFKIKNKDEKCDKFMWDKPILKAKKTGRTLKDILIPNDVGGNRWFDIEFDPSDALNDDECAIYDDTVKIYRCKVGGKWSDSKKRHYIDVKDENGAVFDKYLPMIVVNMVV